VTVDNPTMAPLSLDLPPGTVLRAEGQDWVVGLVRPFRMTARQKTGRTITAFPVLPPVEKRAAPRRLSLSTRTHEQAHLLTELGLAVRSLQESAESEGRRPGPFETWQPFDFWPLVLQWGYWRATAEPARDILVNRIQSLLAQRAKAGDTHADMDPIAAAGEVDHAAAQVVALVPALRTASLPLSLQASLARFH
jgi:hypothetical protein